MLDRQPIANSAPNERGLLPLNVEQITQRLGLQTDTVFHDSMVEECSEQVKRVINCGPKSVTAHYFSEADDPAIQPFTQAFVNLMFAHAAFERRVSEPDGHHHLRRWVWRTRGEPVEGRRPTYADEAAYQGAPP